MCLQYVLVATKSPYHAVLTACWLTSWDGRIDKMIFLLGIADRDIPPTLWALSGGIYRGKFPISVGDASIIWMLSKKKTINLWGDGQFWLGWNSLELINTCLSHWPLAMTGQKPGRSLRGFAKRIGEGVRSSNSSDGPATVGLLLRKDVRSFLGPSTYMTMDTWPSMIKQLYVQTRFKRYQSLYVPCTIKLFVQNKYIKYHKI